MKCAACNYRYKEPVNTQDTELISDGEESFIKIINNFHFKDKDSSLEEAYLFVCPKCGTVRMERW